MPIELHVFNDFDDAKETWLALEKNSELYAFQKYYWLKYWFDDIGKHEKIRPYITALQFDRRTIAILPLCIKKIGLIKCLIWMGGIITDYHAPILVNSLSFQLDLNTIIALLKKTLPRFDYIKFEKQPEIIKKIENPFVTDKCKPNKANAYATRLGSQWDEYYNNRVSSKTRYNNRRNLKMLSELGDAKILIAESNDQRKLITQAMIRQKINRYRSTNAKNIFKSDYYKNFYLNLSINSPENNLNIHISALLFNGEIIATHWGMYDNERFYYLMPTYESNDLSKYSPGKMLQLELMQWCIAHGLSIYDFTVGGENYKHDWCDSELKLYNYTDAVTMLGLPLKISDFIADYIRGNSFLLTVAQKVKRKLSKLVN